MAADGEPKEDGGGSESSGSSASTSSPSPCPPSPAATVQTGLPPPPSPLPVAPASSSAATAAASLPYPPHLYYQKRLLSLHLSPAATPAQPRVANSEPSPAPPSDRPFRDDCWSENATLTLIQAWGDRYLELNRGNLKQKHWKDVADCVNSRPLTCSKAPKSDVQCKNRLDTLKKKYKIEKSKLVTGGARSKWAFFDRLDELIGSSKKTKNLSSGKVSRSAAVVADSNCTTNPDGQCIAMPAAKCATEEDVKRPLFFIPPQAAIALAPPPLTHHVGGVVVHMNHHLGNILHLNHHVGAPIIHPLAGEGAHISHLAGMHNYHLAGSAAGAAVVNHQLGDGGGAATAAADTASKSKADMSQSSLPHNRLPNKRRLKRKRDAHRPNEGGPFRELARAISKFGDVYERVEVAKLEQATALEKQRRELVKDLEIQRMQLFTQMQIERAKMKYGNSKCSNAEDHS